MGCGTGGGSGTATYNSSGISQWNQGEEKAHGPRRRSRASEMISAPLSPAEDDGRNGRSPGRKRERTRGEVSIFNGFSKMTFYHLV
jgi:hypothetical protein